MACRLFTRNGFSSPHRATSERRENRHSLRNRTPGPLSSYTSHGESVNEDSQVSLLSVTDRRIPPIEILNENLPADYGGVTGASQFIGRSFFSLGIRVNSVLGWD